MASRNMPIELVRGAAGNINLTLTDVDATPIDLTGATVVFAVKKKEKTLQAYDGDQATAEILIEQTVHTDAPNGETTIEVTNDDTDLVPGNYVYGIKIIPSSGDSRPSSTAPFIVKPRGVQSG